MKIGAKVVSGARYVLFRWPRWRFREVCLLTFCGPPPPATPKSLAFDRHAPVAKYEERCAFMITLCRVSAALVAMPQGRQVLPTANRAAWLLRRRADDAGQY
jgi:hypothetical protein